MNVAPIMAMLTVKPAAGGKWMRIYGEIVTADRSTITIEREIHDTWRGTTHTTRNAIPRSRIMKSTTPLPEQL